MQSNASSGTVPGPTKECCSFFCICEAIPPVTASRDHIDCCKWFCAFSKSTCQNCCSWFCDNWFCGLLLQLALFIWLASLTPTSDHTGCCCWLRSVLTLAFPIVNLPHCISKSVITYLLIFFFLLLL
jgi:hypothetical protein